MTPADARDPFTADGHRNYGDDPWKLRLTELRPADTPRNETLFAVSNGFLGVRGNFSEGSPVGSHGTFLNGLHETWNIEHAENAYGFAETGQTIVNAPDTKTIRLYVDDERLNLESAEITDFVQELDLRRGIFHYRLTWHTPSGKQVHVETRRFVSLVHRHTLHTEYRVTVDQDAAITLSSLLLNRQDLGRVTTDRAAAAHTGHDGGNGNRGGDRVRTAQLADPRKSERFRDRVLQPEHELDDDLRSIRSYRTTASRIGVVVGMDHELTGADDWLHSAQLGPDRVRHLFQGIQTGGTTVVLYKTAAYDFSTSATSSELVDRCVQQLGEVRHHSWETRVAEHVEEFEAAWKRSEVVVDGILPEAQQAINWNLFQLIAASARADGRGIAAKGLTGSGYNGHYFWDSEIYVSPFLVYTSPQWARNALRFRSTLLPQARARAEKMNEAGALFAWRTINGEESSAYYAAGTAQYHINADITYALARYAKASADLDFIAGPAGDVAIETARLWVSLGFWREETDGTRAFHIHGVTGPDEYTTVVNDNLFTNVMARFNLRAALELLDTLRVHRPDAHDAMVDRLGITEDERASWQEAADGMTIPFDAARGIHPQDAHFLEREVWDLAATPPEQKPLLLHFHPLVIYRFQVLKQADVVLALLLTSQHFSLEEKRANFTYYDRLTTGDSSLSAVVQSILAAEVGYQNLAMDYFQHALRVDLDDLHRNANDGVHIASAGGVWMALVQGFAGMRDDTGELVFDPRLPKEWNRLQFRLQWRGASVAVTLEHDAIRFAHDGQGPKVPVTVRGDTFTVEVGDILTVALTGETPDLGEFPGFSAAMTGRAAAEGDAAGYAPITSEIPTV